MRPALDILDSLAPLRASPFLDDSTGSADPVDAVQDLLAFLGRRYSVGPKHLTLPAP